MDMFGMGVSNVPGGVEQGREGRNGRSQHMASAIETQHHAVLQAGVCFSSVSVQQRNGAACTDCSRAVAQQRRATTRSVAARCGCCSSALAESGDAGAVLTLKGFSHGRVRAAALRRLQVISCELRADVVGRTELNIEFLAGSARRKLGGRASEHVPA